MVFGQLTDWTGSNSIQVKDVHDTDTLVKILNETYPGLSRIKYTVAVDRKSVAGNTPIHPGSSVALMPPFSGG